MYAKLTIPERLKDLRVVDKHLTLEQLAEQTGLSKSALGKYETDDYKDISPFAIATLADFYGVSTDYLMGLTENREVPNADVQSLHLTDEMINLLRRGKINNRLLCELASHPNFRRLMIDMEICIDQIANMRVEQMNLVLEATRQTVLSKYAPEKMNSICGRWNWGKCRKAIFTATSYTMIWTASSGTSGKHSARTRPRQTRSPRWMM